MSGPSGRSCPQINTVGLGGHPGTGDRGNESHASPEEEEDESRRAGRTKASAEERESDRAAKNRLEERGGDRKEQMKVRENFCFASSKDVVTRPRAANQLSDGFSQRL